MSLRTILATLSTRSAIILDDNAGVIPVTGRLLSNSLDLVPRLIHVKLKERNKLRPISQDRGFLLVGGDEDTCISELRFGKRSTEGNVSLALRLITCLVLIIGTTHGTPAFAQVYKCSNAKGKVSYQDSPCDQNTKIGITGTTTTSVSGTAGNSTKAQEPPPVIRQLDAAVRAALTAHDLRRAKDLAVTEKHWEWIAEAEQKSQEQPVIGRTQSDLRAEKSGTQACKEAKRSYELESQSPESIAMKKRLMYEACGMEEPVEVNVDNSRTVVIGNRRPVINNNPINTQRVPIVRPQQPITNRRGQMMDR